jgi:hypothetical protein
MTTTARQTLDSITTERQLLDFVTSYARAHHWLAYHTHRSDHSPAGFPDLCMVRGRRIVFAELKREKGKTTPAQDQWLKALLLVADVSGGAVQVYVWRPSDVGTIMEVLK